MRIFSSLTSAIMLVFMLSSAAAARGEDKIPLSKQLDGLPPAAKIAYVKHLISEGNEDAETYFQLALAFHESDLPDSAIFYYNKTLHLDPEHFKTLVNLGVLYDDQGEQLEAEQYFRMAIKVKPEDVLANSHLAFLLFTQKKYDQAYERLAVALKSDPDHPQPHFYLAIFFWESRIYREAMREWEKVRELAPGSYLAKRAEENIVMLQKALNSPPSGAEIEPEH